jgi:hypothetical protein
VAVVQPDPVKDAGREGGVGSHVVPQERRVGRLLAKSQLTQVPRYGQPPQILFIIEAKELV